MDHLSADQIATLRAKLEAEAADLRLRIADDREEMLLAVNNNEPGDIEDAAAGDAQRFRVKSMLDRDRARLSEVELALARMDSGAYGVCEDTDDPIPFRRLELEPTTRYTVAAQEQHEQNVGVADPFASEPVGY